MRKGWILAGVAAVALALGWYFASPWWTLRSMRAAAEVGDAKALSAHVDFPALRDDVKGEMNRLILAESAKQGDQGMGALGAAFATAFIGPMVDAMITPEGVEQMFKAKTERDVTERDRAAAATPGTGKPGLPAVGNEKEVRIERDGFDQFRVVNDDGKGAMLFRRDGLGWKLSGIDLPPK